MHLSASGWETLFNVMYFGFALGIAVFVLFLYRVNRPKYYGLLYWALFLILGASFLFQIYSGSLDLFLEMKNLKPDEEVVRRRLTEDLRILVFVVPGILLGVAANLITQFLNTGVPQKGALAMATPPDIEMLRTVVYAFALVIAAALLAFAIVGGIAFSKVQTGAGKSFGLLFVRGNFLRISTVVFCVFAVVVLAFAGKLTEGAAAVLSGIAGFVLGGVGKETTEPAGGKNGDS